MAKIHNGFQKNKKLFFSVQNIEKMSKTSQYQRKVKEKQKLPKLRWSDKVSNLCLVILSLGKGMGYIFLNELGKNNYMKFIKMTVTAL